MGSTRLWGTLENRLRDPAEKPDSKGLEGSGRAMSEWRLLCPQIQLLKEKQAERGQRGLSLCLARLCPEGEARTWVAEALARWRVYLLHAFAVGSPIRKGSSGGTWAQQAPSSARYAADTQASYITWNSQGSAGCLAARCWEEKGLVRVPRRSCL